VVAGRQRLAVNLRKAQLAPPASAMGSAKRSLGTLVKIFSGETLPTYFKNSAGHFC